MKKVSEILRDMHENQYESYVQAPESQKKAIAELLGSFSGDCEDAAWYAESTGN